MKKIIGLLIVGMLVFQGALFAEVYVQGYYKQDGTYVQPYYRSSPNDTVQDNYSYRGNYNPHTYTQGTSYDRNAPSSQYYDPNITHQPDDLKFGRTSQQNN